MEFRFGSVAPGQYLGTMPPAETGISTAALAIGQKSLWEQLNAIFAGDPETGWLGLSHYMPSFDERITEAKDEISQIEPDAGIPAGGADGAINWTSLFDGSTDTPTSTTWDLEAGLPFTPTGQIFFSPIIDDPSWGQVVYIIDQDDSNFWRYAIETKSFFKMTSPTYGATSAGRVHLNRTLAISPDGKTLACCSEGVFATSGFASERGGGGRRVEFYDIPSNTWSTSKQTDFLIGSKTSYTRAVVWEDDDILWVWCMEKTISASQGPNSKHFYGKCVKYTKSTDTWTPDTTNFIIQSRSSTSFNSDVTPAAIKADKSVVFLGSTGGAVTPSLIHAQFYRWCAYTVATDSYLHADISPTSDRFCFVYDRDKLWYFERGGTDQQGYVDVEDDSQNDDQFVENTDRTADFGKYLGIHDDLTDIIAHARASIPRMMSAKSGGGYLLGTIYATDWTPILINKPDDNFAISIINAADNVSLSFDHAAQTTLWDGTWKFYYPVAGDYAGISIKKGVP